MNPILFAMRHPITTMMLVVALIGGGGLALNRMRIDIFPPFNMPTIYVFANYNGMSPAQMEGLIVNQYELAFQYVDGVQSIESKSIQQVAVVKLSFFPNTDMAQAMAEVVSEATRAMATMPPSVLPPLIIRMDGGSVPVGYLVLTSEDVTLGIMADMAQQRIRPLVQSAVPGTVATSPFGSNLRAVVVNVDPNRLRSYNLTPEQVVKALTSGNIITPSGNLYIRDQMPLVPTNAMVSDIQEIGKIPVEPGRNVYIHDVATIVDGTDVNFGYALVNGRRSIYIPVVKKNTASTLTVVSDIHRAMPMFQNALPEGVHISYEFDESPTVVASIKSVAVEGLIGATLTGLMILIFLRDWRSVVVVVFNIPMALLGSLCALWLTGATINIMTLGGLALSIGMLVDEATVSIENIHVQMRDTPSLARAVERGGNETAVARLLAMLCILSVFIPAFIMAEPVRSLFVPLALAVGFAMVSSYFLSSTIVPVMSVWLLKHHGQHGQTDRKGLFERVQERFGGVVAGIVRSRWLVVPLYLVVCGLLLWQVGSRLGTELFPQVDSGEFVLRYHAPPGTNFELTRQMGVQCLEVISKEAGPENVLISMGFAGQQAPNYSMNNLILFMRGPDDGQMRVALREDSGIHLPEFRERLRRVLPERIVPWFTEVLKKEGLPPEEAAQRAAQTSFGFEPGDMVSAVMSFGSPTPIEIAVASPNLADARAHATRILNEMEKVPSLRDVQFRQELNYPTVPVVIDRQKAGLSGVTVDQIGHSLLVATSSSRLVARNYWQDPRTGVDYMVQVQVPVTRMNSPQQVETLSLEKVGLNTNLMVRDVAQVRTGSMPGEYDRNAMQRYLSVTANVEGTDLGRAARAIDQAITAAGTPPRGVRVMVRGQISPMNEMFMSLATGLAVAVVVILVLLTAYFESPRLALVSVGTIPGVLSGVAVMLYLTGTTLNIESFMGTIMCIGVSVSNSVMLVTFTARDWSQGMPATAAAVSGARERLRPILMTACAMIVGMVPMSLALEAGSEMQAPLGRAVIGGLLVSTFATLLILPAIFALVMGSRKHQSPSVHPDDPDSKHYHPDDSAKGEAGLGHARTVDGAEPAVQPIPTGGA